MRFYYEGFVKVCNGMAIGRRFSPSVVGTMFIGVGELVGWNFYRDFSLDYGL